MQFYHPCWKTVTKVRSIFRSSAEISIEFIDRKLSLERFLWNHRVLFWQYYQKFPPKVRSFCWMIENKQNVMYFSKQTSSQSSCEWFGSSFGTAPELFFRSLNFLRLSSEITYIYFFSGQLVFRNTFSRKIVCRFDLPAKKYFVTFRI